MTGLDNSRRTSGAPKCGGWRLGPPLFSLGASINQSIKAVDLEASTKTPVDRTMQHFPSPYLVHVLDPGKLRVAGHLSGGTSGLNLRNTPVQNCQLGLGAPRHAEREWGERAGIPQLACCVQRPCCSAESIAKFCHPDLRCFAWKVRAQPSELAALCDRLRLLYCGCCVTPHGPTVGHPSAHTHLVLLGPLLGLLHGGG